MCIFALALWEEGKRERNEGEWGKGGGTGGREGRRENRPPQPTWGGKTPPAEGVEDDNRKSHYRLTALVLKRSPPPSRRWQEIQDPVGPPGGPHPSALGALQSHCECERKEAPLPVPPPIASGRQPPVITPAKSLLPRAAGAEWPIPGGS